MGQEYMTGDTHLLSGHSNRWSTRGWTCMWHSPCFQPIWAIRQFTLQSGMCVGYEESYGYLSGTHARDKDAVVASMLFAEMACYYTYKNITLYEKLNSLFDKFGYFVESSKSIAFKGLDGMEQMVNIMKKFKDTDLTEVAGVPMISKLDLEAGMVKYFEDGRIEMTDLPSANVIKYEFGDDEWLCIRPSGTEPKLKIYVSTKAENKQKSLERNEKLQNAISSLI